MHMTASEILARIHSMFALPSVSGGGQPEVACPYCGPGGPHGVNYVHLEAAQTYLGTDHGGAGHPFSGNGKGDVTLLRFFCEARHHHWALVFAGQKGETKVQLVPMEDSPTEEELLGNVVRFTRRGEREQLEAGSEAGDEPE